MLDKNVLRFDIAMEITLCVQLFEPVDYLHQNLCSFAEAEYFIFKFSLVVDEIASVTIFQKQINIILIFADFVQFADVGWIHWFHTLDLSI